MSPDASLQTPCHPGQHFLSLIKRDGGLDCTLVSYRFQTFCPLLEPEGLVNDAANFDLA